MQLVMSWVFSSEDLLFALVRQFRNVHRAQCQSRSFLQFTKPFRPETEGKSVVGHFDEAKNWSQLVSKLPLWPRQPHTVSQRVRANKSLLSVMRIIGKQVSNHWIWIYHAVLSRVRHDAPIHTLTTTQSIARNNRSAGVCVIRTHYQSVTSTGNCEIHMHRTIWV